MRQLSALFKEFIKIYILFVIYSHIKDERQDTFQHLTFYNLKQNESLI